MTPSSLRRGDNQGLTPMPENSEVHGGDGSFQSDMSSGGALAPPQFRSRESNQHRTRRMSGELGALAMGPGQSSYRMSYNEEMNRLMAEEMAPAAATPSQTPDRFRKPPPEPEPLAKRLAEAEEQTKEASRRCVERLTALLQPLEAQLGDINAALLVERVDASRRSSHGSKTLTCSWRPSTQNVRYRP